MEKTTGSAATMYWPGPSGTLTETSLAGTINEEYIYFNGERIARVDRPSGTVHYYFSNHLGSHTVVTSATGVANRIWTITHTGASSRTIVPWSRSTTSSPAKNAIANPASITSRLDTSGLALDASCRPIQWVGTQGRSSNTQQVRLRPKQPAESDRPNWSGLQPHMSGKDTATCHGGVQGTTTTITDANGNQTTTSTFTATEISNDKNGNLVDQNG